MSATPLFESKSTQQNESQAASISPLSGLHMLLLRLRDIVAAAGGLLLFMPLLVWIAIRIKRDSAGPIFFRGTRIGRKGKPFSILKFRTMYETPDSYQGARVTAQGDPRITPIGKWLRETKLNELPQLWNVLIGEMSLVGPRPEDPEFVARWPADSAEIILSVRPGISSPATVIYRNEEQMLQTHSAAADYIKNIMPNKLRLDVLYVRSRTLWGDLNVLFWTAVVLIPRKHPRKISEQVLLYGPLSRFKSRVI